MVSSKSIYQAHSWMVPDFESLSHDSSQELKDIYLKTITF